MTQQNYTIILQVKVRDVIKMIEKDGWFIVRTRGNHRQFKHNTKRSDYNSIKAIRRRCIEATTDRDVP